MLADGQTYSQIMASLQTAAPTISRWKQRLEEEGLAGLDARHKGSQPRVADAKVQARIVRKAQQKPADGSTHWSCRKMAKALELSKSTVQRLWAQMRFHFTPTYSSWLNQVELWFAKIQRDVIARGVFTSVADLGKKLREYIRTYLRSAKPFRWTYTDPTRRIRPNKIAGTAY